MRFSNAATLRATPTLPTGNAVGFKDWSIICDALGQGRQSLILRKGGIAEGRQGFHFKHEAFFLFPTQYHQQVERVRPEILPTLQLTPRPNEGTVAIRHFLVLEWAEWIDDRGTLARLEPFHVWREDVIRERFAYDEQPGLQCAFGRVYRLEPSWTFEDRAAFGGCRSWITLPEFSAEDFSVSPVLDDREHEVAAQRVREALGEQTVLAPDHRP